MPEETTLPMPELKINTTEVEISKRIIEDLAEETKVRSLENSGEFQMFILNKGGHQVNVRIGVGHSFGNIFTPEDAVVGLKPYIDQGYRVVADYHNHPPNTEKVYLEVGMSSDQATTPSYSDIITDVPDSLIGELGQNKYPHLIGVYTNGVVVINAFDYVREPALEEEDEFLFNDPFYVEEEPDHMGIKLLPDSYTIPEILLNKNIIAKVVIKAESLNENIKLNTFRS